MTNRNRNRTYRSKPLARRIYGPFCFYCGKDDPETVDHVVPVVAGGGNTPGNKVPCCRVCNRLKGELSLEKFISLFSRRIRSDFDPLYAFRKSIDDYGLPVKYDGNRGEFTNHVRLANRSIIIRGKDGTCRYSPSRSESRAAERARGRDSSETSLLSAETTFASPTG